MYESDNQVWSRTTELRTLRRARLMPGFNAETDAVQYEYVLQQKWVCTSDGAEMWEDVPVVHE